MGFINHPPLAGLTPKGVEASWLVEKRVSVFRGGIVFYCVLTPPQDFSSLRDQKSCALPQGEGDLSANS